MGQRMGGNRRYNECLHRRHKYGSTGGQRISGRTRGSGHDQTVCLVPGDEETVDVNIAMVQARDGAFADHNVVEGVILSYACVLAHDIAAHHRTRIDVTTTVFNT